MELCQAAKVICRIKETGGTMLQKRMQGLKTCARRQENTPSGVYLASLVQSPIHSPALEKPTQLRSKHVGVSGGG
jgi:hypothetical protein